MGIQRKSSFGKCLLLLTFCNIVLSKEECKPLIFGFQKRLSGGIILDRIDGIWYEHSNIGFPFEFPTVLDISGATGSINYRTPMKFDICNRNRGIIKDIWWYTLPTEECPNQERKKMLLVISYDYCAIWYSFGTHYNEKIAENFTILTRQKKPAPQTIDTIKQIIADYLLPIWEFKKVDCP